MIYVESNFLTINKGTGERESSTSINKHTNWRTLCKQRHI